jgi:hypothetical protein
MLKERLSPIFWKPRPITSSYPKSDTVDVSKQQPQDVPQSRIPRELEEAVIRGMEAIETVYRNRGGHLGYSERDLQYGIDYFVEAIYRYYGVPMNM